MSDFRLLYVTTQDATEAKKIARILVEEQCVACANIIPKMESIYRWKGQIQEDTESILLLKTHRDLVKNVTDRIKELHSYDIPCVVSLTISEGNPDFLEWIGREVATSCPK